MFISCVLIKITYTLMCKAKVAAFELKEIFLMFHVLNGCLMLKVIIITPK